MNLLSVKRELERLKALARARCESGCVCQYVEIIQNEHLTVEQEELLTRNRDCYAHNGEIEQHVGFTSITVPDQNAA
jgi:hypothetical protein